LGVAAVEALLDDQTSIMVGIDNDQIVHVPLSKTIKLHKSVVPQLLEVAEILIG
jgi:6-phosphofructokinase 1